MNKLIFINLLKNKRKEKNYGSTLQTLPEQELEKYNI